VMRCYLEKPRTTVGWKGMLYDPMIDGSDNMLHGLRASRELLRRVIETGAPIATEALNPIAFQYIEDMVCWSAIGARTTESQTHREMASAMSCAVGFKNGTDGSLGSAVNALLSSAAAHSYYAVDDDGRAAVVRSSGNPYGQLVLRGGKSGTNYDAVHVAAAKKAMLEAGLNPSVMIDCSHENSGKDHSRQAEVVRDIVSQVVTGCSVIRGVMIESHLLEGKQPISDSLCYGQSITDACVGWDETKDLVSLLASSK
jgi:3-deoxy-7-phosphoheptulonate synthase